MVRSLARVVATLGVIVLATPHLASATPNEATVQALLKDLPWRAIGPAIMGGRINDVAVVENNPAIFYVATASGGLWKTINAGTTFTPVFENEATSSIGSVAVCQQNPNIVWIGTGEDNNRQSSSWGAGVFKSTDGGTTWQCMGLRETHHVGQIAIHPRDSDIVYVAANGRLWGPNPERGVYKTTDGGRNWELVLTGDEDTGATDLVLNPAQPDIVYAALFRRRRAAHGFVSGGGASGIYKSVDGGRTWKRLTEGLPKGPIGRVGLDVYLRDPRIVYAVVQASDGGVFRSEDHGETWTRMSATNPRPMYFSKIRVDPNDSQHIWLAGVSFSHSKDGGKLFVSEPRAQLHADIHAIWINPANSDHMLVGCDGGIQWTHDGGKSYDFINTLPLGQFYHAAYDFRKPYWIAGGLQDNGSWIGPSSTTTVRGPTNDEWSNIGGGDGFYCALDPVDHTTAYSESQNGAVRRVNLTTGESKSIRPVRQPGDEPYRFDWNTPFIISPHNHRKILLGGNRLFVSRDRGDTWSRSDDLTGKPDRDKMPILGVPLSQGTFTDPQGGASFGQIVTVSESPAREGIIYVGTDDGNLQVSRDDGKTFTNVIRNVPGVPPGTYVSRVHASPHAEGRVYVTFDGHRTNDFRPFVFVSEDFGATWRDISSNIPEFSGTLVVRDHPRSPNLLFLGTERGLWVSFDRGSVWHKFGAPLPTVPVNEVHVHPRENDLIVATHGRSIYVLDDIAPFEELAREEVSGAVKLFTPRTAVAYRLHNHKAVTGNRWFTAPNAPVGAYIQYFVRSAPAPEAAVKMEILDGKGKRVIRESGRLNTAPGLQRVLWDLRMPSGVSTPSVSPGRQSRSAQTTAERSGTGGRPAAAQASTAGFGPYAGPRAGSGGFSGFAGTVRGPRVLPGVYRVRLTFGEEVHEVPLQVEDDPRVTLSARDRKKRFDLAMGLSGVAVVVSAAARRSQALQGALARIQENPAFKEAPSNLQAAVKKLDQRVQEVRALVAPRPQARPSGPPTEESASETESRPQTAPQEIALSQRIALALSAIESISEAPSKSVESMARQTLRQVDRLRRDVAAIERLATDLNRHLESAKLPTIPSE